MVMLFMVQHRSVDDWRGCGLLCDAIERCSHLSFSRRGYCSSAGRDTGRTEPRESGIELFVVAVEATVNVWLMLITSHNRTYLGSVTLMVVLALHCPHCTVSSC